MWCIMGNYGIVCSFENKEQAIEYMEKNYNEEEYYLIYR